MDKKPPTLNTAIASGSQQLQAATIQAMMVQITTDGIPKLHCPVCNKALVSLAGYVKHLKKHEPPGGFVCRYCEERYCSEDELKRHRDAVHTTLVCRICTETTFLTEHDYREHIRTAHDGIDRKMYKCDKCGADYKTIDPFRRHVDTKCGTVKPHKCDQCSMTFVTKYNLKQHKDSHTGERKFCCSFCGKNFLQKGRLVEHERSHTGEKPYKCDVCGKSFAHRESIVTHSSIHTGIRLVECRCCFSRFSCYSNLIKHRRTRPDTCGLPEYNPPKNRVRIHQSRIPPTLNPTSEIKVSSLNKIIKPGDVEYLKTAQSVKKENIAVKTKTMKATARKRTGRKGTVRRAVAVATKTNRKQKVKTESGAVDDERITTNESDSDNDEVSPTKNSVVASTYKRRATRSSLAIHNGQETPTIDVRSVFSTTNTPPKVSFNRLSWNFTDSDEDDDDCDPADSDDDYDNGGDGDAEYKKSGFKLPEPKFELKVEDEYFGHMEIEELDELDDHTEFEYTNSSEYVDAETAFNVKSENIFNEKDELLDCLLKSDDDEQKISIYNRNLLSSTSSSIKSKIKLEHHFLEETEVVLIKDEDYVAYAEEDILEIKELASSGMVNCEILLEDVTLRYPELKEEYTIKVAQNATPILKPSKKQKQEREHTGRQDRKYRKRGEPKEPKLNGPKRIAKLSQRELKARLKRRKEEKSWYCPHCIKIYHMRKPFEKHLRDDHLRPEEEIKETFKTENVGVVNEEIFKCDICEKIYLVEKRLLAHIKLHGADGNLIFKCPCYCSLYFATKEEATAHAHKEHRELLYCEPCHKFMTGHDSLKNHMKNHHSEREPKDLKAKRNLVCDKCGKKFSGRTSLTDHVRSDCGRKPLYPCNICGKHLTTAGILKTHMLLHKDDTPFQCDQCGKTFKVKAQYKTHIKTRHTDYKPFKCHLCPKEYPYRESLLTHMTVHTGIKRFLCNGCGKRFTCISNLQAHRKVHADSCGALPLNAKATQYMGVQKGNLLLGAKPEAGLDYIETNTLVAKDVLDRDLPMAQELNYPSEPSAPLATVPLNYSQTAPPTSNFLLPQMMMSQYIDDSHSSSYN